MFTGIVEEIGTIKSIQPNKLVVQAEKVLINTEHGSSISVNGICLTVTELDSNSFAVDIMPETMKRTNLGLLKINSRVNLERAMVLGGHLGGHLVQGHIDDTGRVISIKKEQEAILMSFAVPRNLMRYMADKGFIAVNGLSLTIVELGSDSFTVSLVSTTQQITTMGNLRVNDIVNIEVDIIAKYIESLTQKSASPITLSFLEENGYSTK